MRPRTSPAYWPMRILLSIGIASVAVIALWALLPPIELTIGGAYGEFDAPIGVGVLAVAFAAIGLLGMIRVFRTADGEPPRWRYRDR